MVEKQNRKLNRE